MFIPDFRILRIFFPKAFSILLVAFLLILPKTCVALVPGEILVIANRNFPQSSELAHYYMKKRAIPEQNLILLSTTKDERCSREEYDRHIALPVRTYLQKLDAKGLHIRCLLTIHGVPLTVGEPQPREEEVKELERLKELAHKLESQLKGGESKLEEFLNDLKSQYDETQKAISSLSKADQMAAVDSELALVRETDYPLSGWIPSPLFIGFRDKKIKNMPESALLVSRLDGPTVQIVKRVIDDSFMAEKKGLKGKAYFDARWPDPGKNDLKGYAFYDASLHKAAAIVRASKLMETILDEKESLFQPGECGDAALYCGWYSLGKYIDAFKWVPGSVGFHIASLECQTLRQPGSTVWCKMMLEKGIAATIGPVGEPYVESFPVPEVFFGLLLEGKKTLVECFALSSPFVSWRMVLVGDPLYCPFRAVHLKKPQMSATPG
ncbi:MAG: TIGR03790 family protein [Syntrophobacteraceae bacterium]